MSVITGSGYKISVTETRLECPICTAVFDASTLIERADFPVFETNCPKCKSKIGIKMPIFGGVTECFEWDVPKGVERMETAAAFTVNGKVH